MSFKDSIFKKNVPADGGRRMSPAATRLLTKKRYLEQNLDTPIKVLLELLQKESYSSTYFGIPAIKSPLDFWIYLEIVFAVKPDVIIEIGNLNGGSLLAFGHMLDNIGNGKAIGVDINHDIVSAQTRNHPRISLITGDACQVFPSVKTLVKENDRVLIVEDSSHMYQNTLDVLRTYSPLVTKGSYFIVEDSICHHGLEVGPRPGAYAAIETFISENKEFVIDSSRERFLVTWNPKGYLKRV
ncbi:MAG: CmcI family methyltransferase [Candidatus Omnitrophota bacterium]